MGINLKSLGAKIAKYRGQLTESIEEVAAGTGIDSSRLLMIESGQTEPTGDEILILADHFRCDFNFFISNEQVAPFEQIDTLYRAHGQDFGKDDRRSIQDFLYLCETEAFLMAELGLARIDFTFPSSGYYKGDGEAGAAALRTALGYTDKTVPRDIYAELRKLGIHAFRRKLGNSNISGLFIRHPIAKKCALVNFSEDLYRQRFSAAHEMAHAIFDTDFVASVSYDRPAGSDRRETRANRFASCFLMPPGLLVQLPDPSHWTELDTFGWANRLGVSCDALGIALKEAKLVDDATCETIRRRRVPREAKVDPELPASLNPKQRHRKAHLLELGLSDFYVGLCFDALHSGLISVGRLAEALLSSHAGLGEIADIYGRTLHGD